MKKNNKITIDQLAIEFSTADENQLKKYWMSYYPSGSGPSGTLTTVAALIQTVANLRGFDTTKWSKA